MDLLSDPRILSSLSLSISKHLGIADEDGTLSKFLVNLYLKSDHQSKDFKRRHESFEKIVQEEGGEDFPKELINDSFEIISSYQVKAEPEEAKVEQAVHPQVKQETAFNGLSIPNSKIKLESKYDDIKPLDTFVKHETKYLSKITEEEVVVGNVYRGIVSNVAPYGAFIKLPNTKNKSGLCHISKLSYDGRTRIQHPNDIVKLNQEVFVKVEKIGSIQNRGQSRDKISFTMRGIDQVTGEEHFEEHRGRKRENEQEIQNDHQRYPVAKKRLTSPERWEIRQLIASGAIAASEYPELVNEDPDAAFQTKNRNKNGKTGGTDGKDDNEEEIEIELNDDEPPFLKGQTKSSVQLAPVKIIKNPEGSLSRAAKEGSNFVKEFREKKILEQKEAEKKERQKKLLELDPMAKSKTDIEAEINTPSWTKSQARATYGKRTTLSIKDQRESLPVFAMRSDIVQAVRDNQFLVIVGETGSGKTTQIVQYLAEEGLNKGGKLIGCTQPRRVAAVSVATRVAEEVGCKVGQEVGYFIRFEDVTSPDTVIKYMTDGMLQREALTDPSMSKYSVIMLDEAHERTIATDVLFALLKNAAKTNPDLKILVTSATLDSDKFSKYFNDCPIMKIPGRTFPVEIMYTREPELDYMTATLDSVIQIHISEPTDGGDILVFLTGQEEIDTSCEVLFNRIQSLGPSIPNLIILPVYSALPSEIQSKIFEPTPPGSRKCIFATNIAETSITIDGIYFVIDPGFVKVNAYDLKLGMDSLIVSPISQAQANQRSGRAGRTGPGKCYRLYTELAFKQEMLPNTIPEIQRQNLSSTILMLKAMGINDLINFEFMDPPPINTMITALQELYTLEALDDQGLLTDLGRKMADFPMNPALAKTLIRSAEEQFGCSDEILSIVAMLSVQTIFYRPRDKRQQQLADQKKSRFNHSQGDHLTLLNVYKAWQLSGFSRQWCKDNFIQERSMSKAKEVRKQLLTILQKYRYPIISCGMDLDKVRRALCSGFFKSTAKRDRGDDGGYKSLVEQTPVYLHPSSSLFGKQPDYVIYHTLLLTSKEYMHCVTVIDAKWLVELAPAFFKQADLKDIKQRRKNEKIVPLFDKFNKNQDAWRLRSKTAVKSEALNSLRNK